MKCLTMTFPQIDVVCADWTPKNEMMTFFDNRKSKWYLEIKMDRWMYGFNKITRRVFRFHTHTFECRLLRLNEPPMNLSNIRSSKLLQFRLKTQRHHWVRNCPKFHFKYFIWTTSYSFPQNISDFLFCSDRKW